MSNLADFAKPQNTDMTTKYTVIASRVEGDAFIDTVDLPRNGVWTPDQFYAALSHENDEDSPSPENTVIFAVFRGFHESHAGIADHLHENNAALDKRYA